MKLIILLLACVILQSICSNEKGLSYHSSIKGKPMQPESQKGSEIDKEAAIRIAKEQASRSSKPLEAYNLFPCEQAGVWRVFLEPKNIHVNPKGAEYIISKCDGKVLSQQEINLVVTDKAGKKHSLSPSSGVKEENAVAIARRDASKAYGSLSSYDLRVCELAEMWSVIYAPKIGMNGGGPEYLIDKETGKILYRRYYQ